MRVFKNLSFPFKHTSNTLFLLMSLCRFKKTGLHLTTYLKWLIPPPCTGRNAPPKVWCQNCTEPVPWASENDWSFKSCERIRAKKEHEAGSPGPHQYVRRRADSVPQTTKELHNVGAWNSRQSCHGQGTCERPLKMRCTFLHNMFFISLATLHLLETEERAVSFAWPCFSWFPEQPWLPLEVCCLPNQSVLSTHCANAHLG